MKLDFYFNRSFSRGKLPPGDRRFWFFGRSLALSIDLGTENCWRFEVFYRRLVVVLVTLLVVLWVGASAGLYYWLNRTPHNQVAWRDLAAPWRWSGLKTKRGDTAILNAVEDLKNKNFSSGFYGLRVGLARSPGNVSGRMTLVRLLRPGNPAEAIKTAEEGIAYSAGDPAFLGALISLYFDLQIRTRALETVDALLKDPRATSSPEGRYSLARARVALLMELNRGEEAEAAIATVAPVTAEQRASLHTLHIELLVRSGHIAQARQLAASFSDSAALSVRQQVEIAIALEDSDALQSALLRLRAQAPEEPSAYLIGIQSWSRLNRSLFVERAQQEYFRFFASNGNALQAISTLGVTQSLPEIISRALAVAQANRISLFPFRVHLTEYALRQGDFEQATRVLRMWENQTDAVNAPQRYYPEFIKRLTRVAFTNAPEQTNQFLSFLSTNGNRLSPSSIVMAVGVLEKADNLGAASQMLQQELAFYPYSDPLLDAKKRIDAKLPNPAEMVTDKSASTDRATVVAVTLPDNVADALKQIDALLREDQLSAARDLMRAIRSQKPTWLSANESDIGTREVELAFLTLDRLSSRAAVRSYLARERSEASGLKLVELAARLRDSGRNADALVLRDEILSAPAGTEAVRVALQQLNLVDDLTSQATTRTSALSAMDAAIASHDWSLTERWLKYLREKPPEWADAAALIEIKVREIKIRLGLDQRPSALNAFRDLILKSGASRDAGFALVRELAREGEEKSALILAKEAVRLLPGETASSDLLKEIEALAATSSG